MSAGNRLGAIAKRLLKGRPRAVRRWFVLSDRYVRRELNDLARRLDK